MRLFRIISATMRKDCSINKIHRWVDRINKSQYKIRDFFLNNDVPFSRSQYYRYKKVLESGKKLSDGRVQGNSRKLSAQAEGFLLGLAEKDQYFSLHEMQRAIKNRFNILISESGISKFLKRHNVFKKYNYEKSDYGVIRTFTPCAGLEVIVAIAYHLGWLESVSLTIIKRIKEIKNSEYWKCLREDTQGRNKKGQFTKKYNLRKIVRTSRFSSIETKRESKNFRSMNITLVSKETIIKKCITALLLPVVTNNGILRTIDTPKGNALASLCGVNYKQSTMNKFFSDLKYLGISELFLKEQATFWLRKWDGERNEENEGPYACFFLDGNTKALWSKRKVQKGKVTMSGKIMGCIEHLFIHDNYGRPFYFKTFSGNAPSGKYILEFLNDLEVSLKKTGEGKLVVNRTLVLDSASNSVETLRAFALQKKYHYITSLDDNQWNPRKLQRVGRPECYQYGNAILRDCEIELNDSKEKKEYLVLVRAIKIDWDYGKTTVLITSLSKDVISAGSVVKSYFERWPFQELDFRTMKAGVSINRVAGYGMQKSENLKTVQAQEELKEKIKKSKKELSEVIGKVENKETAIAKLVLKERGIRVKGKIKNGNRILSRKDTLDLRVLKKEINKTEKSIKELKEPDEKKFNTLTKMEKKWMKLQGKEHIFKIDLELDQIMTSFRIGLANICNIFSKEYMADSTMVLSHMIQRILNLPGVIEESNDVKKIILHYDQKNKKLMSQLETALGRINSLCIQNVNDKKLLFEIGNIDSHLSSR